MPHLGIRLSTNQLMLLNLFNEIGKNSRLFENGRNITYTFKILRSQDAENQIFSFTIYFII